MSDRRYAWYVLILLALINFMNYLDRQVMFALYPYVQEDLGFTDFELGLLAPAFLIVHSLFSIPGGVLADRWFKRKVIALGVGLWSLATLLGAIARGFVDMFIYRALVGVGEAAYGPAANAMISDYFPLGSRARAMGLFSVGMVVGGGAGMIAGTVIGDYLGWRYAFFVAGIPGFLLAVLAWRLKEVKAVGERPQVPSTGYADLAPKIKGGGWRQLFRTSTLRLAFAGGICITFCIGGLVAWMITFLDRYHVKTEAAPPAAEAVVRGGPSPNAPEATLSAAPPGRKKGHLAGLGISFGAVALAAGLLGTLAGGFLADRLMRRLRAARLLVSASGFLLGVPFALLGLYATSATVFLVGVAVAIFFFVWYTGPIIAILHDVVARRYRSTIAAAYIFSIHLLGDAISPPIVGWISGLSGLREALLLPVGMAVVGAVLLLLATRTVARDMEAAAQEGAADALSAATAD
jgi:MFS family permease